MISIKDYAQENGVSYEAVRQQVIRYKDELAGHIRKQGRTQYLDDVAVAILNDHRAQNPVVVYNKDAGEQLRNLRAQVEELEQNEKVLLAKIAAQADQIAQLAAWKADNALAIAEAGQNKLLLESTTAALEQAKTDNRQLSQEAADARQEASRTRQERDAAEDGKKAVEDENHLLRQQMEQMQHRSRWDRFKDVFR